MAACAGSSAPVSEGVGVILQTRTYRFPSGFCPVLFCFTFFSSPRPHPHLLGITALLPLSVGGQLNFLTDQFKSCVFLREKI